MDWNRAFSLSSIFRNRNLLLVAILVLLFNSRSFARTVKSEDDLYSRSLQSTLEFINKKFHAAEMHSERDPLIIFITGSAYVEAWALSPSSASPEKLAQTLDRAVKGTVLAQRPVKWSKKRGLQHCKSLLQQESLQALLC
jgi:hypothetical protein